jgi:hypothetical protein
METSQDLANVDNEPHQAPKALNGPSYVKWSRKTLTRYEKEIQD